MQIFVTGTDTDVGKTIVSSWICLHTKADYFKPIQAGFDNGTDSETVSALAGVSVHPETYLLTTPCSPHLAAEKEGLVIDIHRIQKPQTEKLVVEGAGGVMVPIHQNCLMRDLIKFLDMPALVVSSTRLGTINHTLLTLHALRDLNIPILGVVMTGDDPLDNARAIESYGDVEILAHLPHLSLINRDVLAAIELPDKLQEFFL